MSKLYVDKINFGSYESEMRNILSLFKEFAYIPRLGMEPQGEEMNSVSQVTRIRDRILLLLQKFAVYLLIDRLGSTEWRNRFCDVK